jgi:hypothetical protein
MKKTPTLFSALFILICINSFAQTDSITNPNWNVGTAKGINGTSIFRVSGANNDTLGVTNISYLDYRQIVNDVNAKAAAENWSEERKQLFLKSYESTAKGGKIELYIERKTITAGDFKNFTIVVKRVLGKTMESEVYTEILKKDVPDFSKTTKKYFNSTSILLNDPNLGKIVIYVIEGTGPKKHEFKFELK